VIWRVLVFFDVLTVAAYVYRERGETAAWAAGHKLLSCPFAGWKALAGLQASSHGWKDTREKLKKKHDRGGKPCS
jgi:hypothetical protein